MCVSSRDDGHERPCRDATRGRLKTSKRNDTKNLNCFYTPMKQIRTTSDSTSLTFSRKNKSFDLSNKSSLRSTHSERSILAKQRVIKMLIVIVIIFFCCWTPNYMWWLLLTAQDSFKTFDIWNSEVNTAITVLCYISSCANPITYCFLNKKFRTALLITFGCPRKNPNQFQTVYMPEVAMDALAQKRSNEDSGALRLERTEPNDESPVNVIHSETVLYHHSTNTTMTTTTAHQERKRPVLD
uniref:G-protein coupled receptors family 1 profile domain-containing protein n=1 Tax=Setaria digitata TaxID=48799 RepID=A0A915PJV4_9BILA